MMPPRDFILMVVICAVWSLNVIVSKIAVTDLALDPLFYTAARALVIIACLWPWLLPMPRPRWRLLFTVLLMGGAQFALLFIGLQTVPPSIAAIVSLLNVPLTTLLSLWLLGERVQWRRGTGIALALSGTLIVIWEPAYLQFSTGIIFVVLSTLAGALGAVAMKRMRKIEPFRFQAWVGLTSVLLLAPLSASLESGQFVQAAAVSWQFTAAVLFSALIVSIGAHSAYYHLVQKHDANLIAPLTLMTPLFTVAIGVFFLGDQLGLQTVLGGLTILVGVSIIIARPSQTVSKPLIASSRL